MHTVAPDGDTGFDSQTYKDEVKVIAQQGMQRPRLSGSKIGGSNPSNFLGAAMP